MDLLKKRPMKGWLLFMFFSFGLALQVGAGPFRFLASENFSEKEFGDAFIKTFRESGILPEKVTIGERKYTVKYTFNSEIEAYVSNLLKSYRSDFASVVIIDNQSGKVLTAQDLDRNGTSTKRWASFTATHPSASIFKMITAADLLENTHVSHNTEFIFSGRSTTLYKSQLKTEPKRWIRHTDFEEAFARSNNVIFGKAALENLSPSGLRKMAERFGFNHQIIPFINSPSYFPLAVDQFNLAELASGYNTKTVISPLHGAVMSSIVANQGIMKTPIFIEEIQDEAGKVVWRPEGKSELVLTTDTSENLRKLMMATVSEGTARRSFKKSPKTISELEVGGKTGTITGGDPYGKHDWFVSYAKDPQAKDAGISVCVMIVNKRRWYVKSSLLSRQIIEYYYRSVKL